MKKPFRFTLDPRSGVPIYRQIIDQVTGGMAAAALAGGDQLPTVRQLAVDLSINPNTVIRAYRELEIRGLLDTHQGSGTFISHQEVRHDDAERQRQLNQLLGEFVARAGSAGFTVKELIEQLQDLQPAALAAAAGQDLSPHKVQFVSVADGVRLEVLDWGGTGRPCVLLAGYLTAHAFDELAPKLAQTCHVYGITRAATAPRAGRRRVILRIARRRMCCRFWMR